MVDRIFGSDWEKRPFHDGLRSAFPDGRGCTKCAYNEPYTHGDFPDR